MHGEEVCVVKGGGRHAWQERQPLQRTVRILLECILVPDQLGLQPTFGETGLVY